MTPPIDPQALQRLLQALPEEREDQFPHHAFLTPDRLLQRRVEITEQLKTLEQERQAIDEELSSIYGSPELLRGVRAPGGWTLRQRSRTSWQYPANVKDLIRGIQQNAQQSGTATELRTTYLVLTREEL